MTAYIERTDTITADQDARIVLLDLDSMLFNTRRFGGDLWQDISSQAHIPAAVVRSDADNFEINPALGGYNFARHVASYGLDETTMWGRLQALLNGKSYLYEDAPPFVQGLRADGFEPQILSYGEHRIQSTKIVSCLAELVGPGAIVLDYEVTDRPKRETIRERYPGQQGFLVDDVRGQLLQTGFVEINIDRSRNLQEPEQIVGGFAVSNLIQAREVIRSL